MTTWPTDTDINAALEQEGSIRGAARNLGVAYETLRQHLNGNAKQQAGQAVGQRGQAISINADGGEVSTTGDIDLTIRPEELNNIDAFAERIGVGESQGFNVAGVSISNATGEARVSLRLNRKKPEQEINLPQPARGGKPIVFKGLPRAYAGERGHTIAVASDLHGRDLDQDVFGAFLSWLRKTKPDELILAGDILDLPNISRFAPTDLTITIQEELDTTFDALAAIRANLPAGTRIRALMGNHDIRLDNYTIANASQLFALKRAKSKDKPVLSLPYLLRFDELEIEEVSSADGSYPHPYIQIAPDLIVEHGSKARKQAGQTPLASMENRPYGVINGHTHRMGLVRKSIPQADSNAPAKIVVGAEIGCLCSMRPSYAPARDLDWAQGWACVTTWPEDGAHDIELISYRYGYATFRGERFSADG